MDNTIGTDLHATATVGIEQAQATMRDGMQTAMKTAQELFSFAQGNIEAVTRSGQILASGVQDLSQSAATTARASMEDTVTAFKALASVKSVREAMDLQTALFRSIVERAVSQTSQMTDSGVKLSEQAMAPITARLTLAAGSLTRAA